MTRAAAAAAAVAPCQQIPVATNNGGAQCCVTRPHYHHQPSIHRYMQPTPPPPATAAILLSSNSNVVRCQFIKCDSYSYHCLYWAFLNTQFWCGPSAQHSSIMKLPATAQKRRTKEIVKSNRTVGRRHDWYCFCSGLHWWHWTFLFQEMCNQWICSTSWVEVLRDVTQFSLHLFICSFVIIISSIYNERSSQV